ncbi:MAG: hypothetical protein ACK43N_00920, partial [Pirellulaceae bacterium]
MAVSAVHAPMRALLLRGKLKSVGGTNSKGGWHQLECWQLECWQLECWQLECWQLECWQLECW